MNAEDEFLYRFTNLQGETHRFRTLKECFAFHYAHAEESWKVSKIKPRNPQQRLADMLESRGITWRVWYRRRRPLGWMINDGDAGMLRLGHTYAEAVDMIRSGTLDFLVT